MIDDASLDRYARVLIATVLLLVGTVISPGGMDPFSLPKAMGVVLAGVAAACLLASSSWRPVWESRLRVYALALGAFMLTGAIVVVVAPVTWIAVVGREGRHSGMAVYASCALLALLAMRTVRPDRARTLLRFGVAATAFNAVYALLQRVGADPLRWTGDAGAVIATMGNPNFAAGYLAIGGALAVGAALMERPAGWRAFAWGTAFLAALATVATGSAQGPLALAAGVALPVLVAVIGLPSARRRVGLAVYGAAALVGLGGLVSAAFNVGPMASFLAGGTLETRLWYWRAAWDMFIDHPILGVGMDMFGSFYRRYRPLAPTLELGITNTSDAVHSVPLAMLAQGGLLLATAYLAVVAVTTWGLVRGLRRTHAQERLLLGAFGGAWLAYQAQSLVSIDVPALALWHFVSSAVIVALGLSAGSEQGARKEGVRSRSRKAAAMPLGALVSAAVFAAALGPLTRPLRADGLAADGRRLLAAGRTENGVEAYREAIRLAPWHADYRLRLANAEFAAGRVRQGYHAVRLAAAADPTSLPAVLTAARAADRVGEEGAAMYFYGRALRIEPGAPELMAEAGAFALRAGDADQAIALLGEAVELLPAQDEWWISLGRAYAAAGRSAQAREAYHRAMSLVPQHARALEGLAALEENSG